MIGTKGEKSHNCKLNTAGVKTQPEGIESVCVRREYKIPTIYYCY